MSRDRGFMNSNSSDINRFVCDECYIYPRGAPSFLFRDEEASLFQNSKSIMRDKSRQKRGYWKFCSIWLAHVASNEETPYPLAYLPHLLQHDRILKASSCYWRDYRGGSPLLDDYLPWMSGCALRRTQRASKTSARLLRSSPEIKHLISEGAAPLPTSFDRSLSTFDILKIAFPRLFLPPSSHDRVCQFSSTKGRK